MQKTTYIDSEDHVKNPCPGCSYDCPRFCDCEVCSGGESKGHLDLSALLDMDF